MPGNIALPRRVCISEVGLLTPCMLYIFCPWQLVEALGRLSDIARRMEQQQQQQEEEEHKQQVQLQQDQEHQEQRQQQGQQHEQGRDPDQEPELRDQPVGNGALHTRASCGVEGDRVASCTASGGCGSGSSAGAQSGEWRAAMDECVALLMQSAARAREVRGAGGWGLGAGWMAWGACGREWER